MVHEVSSFLNLKNYKIIFNVSTFEIVQSINIDYSRNYHIKYKVISLKNYSYTILVEARIVPSSNK